MSVYVRLCVHTASHVYIFPYTTIHFDTQASAIQATILVAFTLLYNTVIIAKSPTAGASAVIDTTSSTPSTNAAVKSTGTGETTESIPMVLKRVTRNPIFWLMLLGKMSLMCVGQFISFMPLYLQTGFAMSSPQAAAASSLFALGSLTSSLLLIPTYQKMKPEKQVKTIAGLVRHNTHTHDLLISSFNLILLYFFRTCSTLPCLVYCAPITQPSSRCPAPLPSCQPFCSCGAPAGCYRFMYLL